MNFRVFQATSLIFIATFFFMTAPLYADNSFNNTLNFIADSDDHAVRERPIERANPDWDTSRIKEVFINKIAKDFGTQNFETAKKTITTKIFDLSNKVIQRKTFKEALRRAKEMSLNNNEFFDSVFESKIKKLFYDKWNIKKVNFFSPVQAAGGSMASELLRGSTPTQKNKRPFNIKSLREMLNQ